MGKKEFGLLGLGLGVGFTVALLYAPRKGAVTRRFVRAKASSAAGLVKGKAVNLSEAAVDAVQQSKRKASAAKEALSAAYQVGREAFVAETGTGIS